jgi:hypothetical protein
VKDLQGLPTGEHPSPNEVIDEALRHTVKVEGVKDIRGYERWVKGHRSE